MAKISQRAAGRAKTGPDKAKKINVDIAPANWMKLKDYITAYNQRPDRITPVLKYTDIINEALDQYLVSKQ